MTRQRTPLQAALEDAWKDPTLHQEFFTLQLCTSGSSNTTKGLRTQEEGNENKRKSEGGPSQGNEVKKLKAQIDSLTRALKDANTSQATSSPQLALMPPPAPHKGANKGKGKGRATGAGHGDESKAIALTNFRKQER